LAQENIFRRNEGDGRPKNLDFGIQESGFGAKECEFLLQIGPAGLFQSITNGATSSGGRLRSADFSYKLAISGKNGANRCDINSRLISYIEDREIFSRKVKNAA
jgi:hypothetical protein